jgi:zinc carboxypeptidase
MIAALKRVCVVILVVCATGDTGRTAEDTAPTSLSEFFAPGTVFQDRNGDGAVDFVNARIVLPEHPTAGELAAAADIAARLGFETSAMDLPLDARSARRSNPQPSIFVGAKSLAGSGLNAAVGGGSVLKAGEGVVAAFKTSGQPSIAVLGDEEGLEAAAVMLAGHLPFVWDQKSLKVGELADAVRDFLTSKGIRVSSAMTSSIMVRRGAQTVERAYIDVQMPDGGDVVKAQAALNQLRVTRTRDARRPLSFANVRSVAVRIHAPAGAAGTVVLSRPSIVESPSSGPPPGRRPGGGAKENFDLSAFYSNEGALADSDSNLIPDRVDVVLSPADDATNGVVDLAARLGLESTGIAVPIAKPAKAITAPESEPILVLIGVSHPVVEDLIKNKKWERPSLQPGEGLIQVVRKAFGEKSALIVTGADVAGVNRAVSQLAERFPHIWSGGKDRTTLDEVEEAVRKFVSGRSPAAQAAMSLYKLDALAKELAGKSLSTARVRVFVEKAADGLDAFVQREATARIKADAVTSEVQNLDVQKGRSLVADDFDIPSEVDEFWTRLRTRVLPSVRKQQSVTVEARLSEPPELREEIARRARAELIKAGADERSTAVTILSAYKQGYSWLYDAIRPELKDKHAEAMTIRFAEIGPPPSWKQQGMFAPTRWLLELYPIDEILASELKIDLRNIRFEKMPIGSTAYEVIATGRGGVEVLRRTFEPKTVERAFFDRFPDYEHVRVTTGWIKADVAGRTVVDERIATDLEKFWDHFQGKTLPALYDHVMALGKGKPRAEDAPFFGELTVDLTLSEPEYRLPVDQEQISSLEAMHEEIYFNTLHFFDVMGRFTRGPGLIYPGRVIPIMHAKSDGMAGRAKISITGFDAPRPSVVIEYTERDGRRGEVKLDVPRIAVDRPQTLAALVRAGHDGIARLDLRVKVDSEKDEHDALVKRAAEERVDRTVISAEQVQAVFENLTRLRAAGLYRDALAFHDLGSMRVSIAWEHDSKPATERVATLQGGNPAPFPDIRKYLASGGGATPAAAPLVQWDTPIPPPEAYAILARMAAFKEATVYKVGESYLGKDVWAMDLMPPIEATHWSQAKQTTMKPTIVYSARQHANEVSSTSHVLKMAELLLTDPAYRAKLNKVNVVVHPITNADGAQLAYDLQKINPTYMLHAGYLGALGVDVTSAQWEADPIYPESGIRPKIWRTWLPDIFLNPHGYPTHEWVQLFSEYAAWVRTRAVETRDYWTMRGWWMPGFGWLDDPRYPRHKNEQMKLLNTITEFAKAAPGTVALNQRAYDRYRRYSFDFDQKNFKLDFTNGVLIYKAIKGARANPQSQDFMTRQPNVTIWDGSTEAPDETARGEWMKLVANAGLQWDKAILEYLVLGNHEVERKIEPFWNGASLTMTRARPPKAKEKDEGRTTQ